MKNLHHIKLFDVESIANKTKFSLTGRHRTTTSTSYKEKQPFLMNKLPTNFAV